MVAINYCKWMESNPFDVGSATRAALSRPTRSDSGVADGDFQRASKHNSESKANGALMRSSPLAIWSTRVSVEEAVNAARLDASLTHPNLSCQWASVAYVVAIRHLLQDVEGYVGAFNAAVEVVSVSSDEGAEEVRSWLEDARQGNLPDCHPMAGFVRIAFTHAFFHLLQQTPFIDAMRQVLAGGGDTDTNACIAGGLIGARAGLSGVPEHMRQAVLRCDTTHGRPRPLWLQTGDAMELAASLTGVTTRAAAS